MNVLVGQDLDSIKSIPVEDVLTALYGDHTITHEDSIMLDNINHMLEIKAKLDSTIFSLEKSEYSNNLKRIVYENYVLDIEKNLKYQLEFIAKNTEKYRLYGETYDSGKTFNKKYIFTNAYLQDLLANYILENNLLSNCEFFKNLLVEKNQIYDLALATPFQFGYTEYIAFVMKDKINKLLKLKNDNSNECTIENVDSIISTGKKVPYLKDYYK